MKKDSDTSSEEKEILCRPAIDGVDFVLIRKENPIPIVEKTCFISYCECDNSITHKYQVCSICNQIRYNDVRKYENRRDIIALLIKQKI